MSRHRMAAVDAAWLHMDRPTNELVVSAVLWFDEPLDDAAVRDAVEHRLVGAHPRFAQRVEDTGRVAWWVDVPDFDPMTHVRRHTLPAPGDLAALHRLVTALVAEPLDRGRPLWRLDVVAGYDGGTAIVARMHHCIADGVALFRVLLSLSDEAQDGGLPAPVPATPGTRPPAVARASRAVVAAGRVVTALAGLLVLPPDRRTALRAPLGTAKTARWSEPLPLDAVKAAARAAGVTINDLVLGALAGALRRHLLEDGATLADVHAVLPVNLRPLDTPRVELGNRFGLVFLRLPLSVRDAGTRVAAVARGTRRLKASAAAPVTLGILRVAGHAHRRLVALLVAVFSAKGSLVVTNVPGPRQPLHLAGRRLAGVVAWPPQSGSLGVGVSVISYGGAVVLGVLADDRALPRPDGLLAALRAELEDLGVRPDVPAVS